MAIFTGKTFTWDKDYRDIHLVGNSACGKTVLKNEWVSMLESMGRTVTVHWMETDDPRHSVQAMHPSMAENKVIISEHQCMQDFTIGERNQLICFRAGHLEELTALCHALQLPWDDRYRVALEGYTWLVLHDGVIDTYQATYEPHHV